MDKEKIIQIIIIVVLIIILGILAIITINEINKNNPAQMRDRDNIMQNFENPNEQTTEKETTASDIDAGEEITESDIDLSKYNSNITITKAGEYTLTGEFKNSILVNAEGSVTLILNGVNIQNDITATIANIGGNDLIIELEDNTVNTLSDGGSSEYDGCIYSNGAITIERNGTLNVYGNQEGGEGIALGSDMLEKPETNSAQNSICFELSEQITEGTEITIRNENDEEIISFEARGDFRTLIVSNSKVSNGTYYLYKKSVLPS